MAESSQLDRFRRHGTAVSQAPAEGLSPSPQRQTRPYEAFRESAQEQRFLELRPAFPEQVDIARFFDLCEITGDFRFGTHMALFFGHLGQPLMAVVIEGKNLQKLFPVVKGMRADFLAAFDPYFHDPVTDESQPVITSMEIRTSPPEQVPPPAQRH